jgi:hypothetical protein
MREYVQSIFLKKPEDVYVHVLMQASVRIEPIASMALLCFQ